MARPNFSCLKLHDGFAYLLLTGAVLAVYANIYHNAFLYDDNQAIVCNGFLRDWHFLYRLIFSTIEAGCNIETSYYRPLQGILYFAIFQAFGLSTIAFHAVNIALHIVNTGFVYKLGLRLNFKQQTSFIAALLWGLHPIQTEAVVYMSGTSELLSAMFCLAGLLVLVPTITLRPLMTATLLMGLALLSKESAVIFPLLAACNLYLMNEYRFEWRTYRKLWPLFLLALLYTSLHYMLLPQGSAGADIEPLTTNFVSLTKPLRILEFIFLPLHQYFGHELPIYNNMWHSDALLGLVLFLLATLQIMRHQSLQYVPFSWGLVWFLSAFLPVLPIDSIFYEHWLYVPSIGLFLGGMETLERFFVNKQFLQTPKSKYSIIVIVGLLIVSEGFLTYRQNEFWYDPVTFYTRIIHQGDKAAKAHANLGAVYMQQGATEQAIAESEIAIRNSGDTLAVAQTNLAIAQLVQPHGAQETLEALKHLQRALEIDPGYYPAYVTLAHFYEEQGDFVRAGIYRTQASKIKEQFSGSPR